MSRRNFVVATDSRVREGEVLFLVDRVRRKDIWWSNDLKDALVLSQRDAYTRVSTVRFNNPRVMDLEEAQRVAKEVSDGRAHDAGMNGLPHDWNPK